MTYSTVSSMVLFLLVLLVFPHIDMVFGAQMEHRKLKENNHADQVTVKDFQFNPEKYFPKISEFLIAMLNLNKIKSTPTLENKKFVKRVINFAIKNEKYIKNISNLPSPKPETLEDLVQSLCCKDTYYKNDKLCTQPYAKCPSPPSR